MPGAEALQRKVGFEFEIGVPVRGRDGSRPTEKTKVGDWNGARFVVDNSEQLNGLTDGARSAVEMVTPPFDETGGEVDSGVEFVESLGGIAESMKGAVEVAADEATAGRYNWHQPDSRVREDHVEEDEAIKDIPSLIPDDREVEDMLTRHELVYPDFRLGLHSTDAQADKRLLSSSGFVQATVGADLEHIRQLFAFAAEPEQIRGYAGEDKRGRPSMEHGIAGIINVVLDYTVSVSKEIEEDLNKLEGKPEAHRNLEGLLSILALYLVAGKHYEVGTSLLKNFVPILSRSNLGEVAKYALAEQERSFVASNLEAIVKIALARTGRAFDEPLILKSVVTHGETLGLTCGETLLEILTGKGDPVMRAIAAEESGLSGSSQGTVIDVRQEEVGRRRPGSDVAPHGETGRRIAPALELRALAPLTEKVYLPVDRWAGFAKTVLTRLRAINLSEPRKSEKSCFLSTACASARGLPDDCEELTILRAFRDGYLRHRPEGPALIAHYYAVAPAIVRRLQADPSFAEIIDGLYWRLVLRSVRLIQAHQPEEALRNYCDIARELETRYLGARPVRPASSRPSGRSAARRASARGRAAPCPPSSAADTRRRGRRCPGRS